MVLLDALDAADPRADRDADAFGISGVTCSPASAMASWAAATPYWMKVSMRRASLLDM